MSEVKEVKTAIETLNESLIVNEKIDEQVLEARALIGTAYCSANEARSKSLRAAVNKACDDHGDTSPQAQSAMRLQDGVRGKILIFGNVDTDIPTADVDGLILKHEVGTKTIAHTDEETGKKWIAEYNGSSNSVKKLKIVLYEAAIKFKAVLAAKVLDSHLEDYKKTLVSVAKNDFWNTAVTVMMSDAWPNGLMDKAAVASIIYTEAKKSGKTGKKGEPKEYTYSYEGYDPKNNRNTDNIGEIVIAIGSPDFDLTEGVKHVMFKDGKFDFNGYDTLGTIRKVKAAMKAANATMEFPTVTRTNVADGSTTVV